MTGLPYTSALACSTSPRLLCDREEQIVSPNESFVTRNPVDKALAELDMGLGLGYYYTTPIVLPIAKSTALSSIEDELDAALLAIQNQPAGADNCNENSSCVSDSAVLRRSNLADVKSDYNTEAVDVLQELQALDSRTSATVMSPPLAKSQYRPKRR